MKAILNIIFLLAVNIALAQYPILSTTSLADPNDDNFNSNNANYAVDTSNSRQQYVGTWEYNQNGILFQLKIEKLDQRFRGIIHNGELQGSYNYYDEVILKYKLIINGNLLFDNLSETNLESIKSYGWHRQSDGYLGGKFLEYTRNVYITYEINRLFTTPAKINFNLERMIYTLLSPLTSYHQGEKLFLIPTGGIEMIKIN